jgi:hypothetical protein
MKPPVTYSHPKPVIAIIHMPFRSDGSSYAEVTSEARRLWKNGRNSVSLSTDPFKSLWAGVGARIHPDTDFKIIRLW